MLRIIIIATFWANLSTAATADTINITNSSQDTIYRLYAWPTDLVPRNYNVLGQPLTTGSKRKINVDNSYNDCRFTIQYDPNNPSDKRKIRYRYKRLKTAEINICIPNVEILLK